MVMIDDLINGRRARVSEKEFAALLGVSRSLLQKHRWRGTGWAYQKDEHGRVWYSASTVLETINLPEMHSTSEYVDSTRITNVEKARAAIKRSA